GVSGIRIGSPTGGVSLDPDFRLFRLPAHLDVAAAVRRPDDEAALEAFVLGRERLRRSLWLLSSLVVFMSPAARNQPMYRFLAYTLSLRLLHDRSPPGALLVCPSLYGSASYTPFEEGLTARSLEGRTSVGGTVILSVPHRHVAAPAALHHGEQGLVGGQVAEVDDEAVTARAAEADACQGEELVGRGDIAGSDIRRADLAPRIEEHLAILVHEADADRDPASGVGGFRLDPEDEHHLRVDGRELGCNNAVEGSQHVQLSFMREDRLVRDLRHRNSHVCEQGAGPGSL